MRFADPSALWLLLLVVVVVAAQVYGRMMRNKSYRRLADTGLLPMLLLEVSSRRRLIRAIFISLALTLLCAAALRPQWGERSELARHRGLDVIFALDVSQSMLARDVLPDRLHRAQAEISSFVDQLAGNRIGIIAFAGTAFVQCPLTTDQAAVQMFLNALTPDVVPQGGTAIARALNVAARVFADSADKASQSEHQHGQVLILLTDGEDHEGEVKLAANKLKEQGVTLFVVGVGSEQGEPIPLFGENDRVLGYLKDKDGKPVLSRLERTAIEQLADAAGGTALFAPDLSSNLQTIAREVDKLAKSDFESRVVVHYQERLQWPLAIGLLAMLAAVTLRERRRLQVEAK